MRSALCVPSPLLGPSSWEPFARILAGRGARVEIADLRPALEHDSPMWPEMVRLAHNAARRLEGEVTVVGHSGAGALLPGVGAALGRRLERLVFVDAILPPTAGAHRYGSRIREMVAGLATDGVLPPWLDWWPPDTITAMLGDPALVGLLRSDIPDTPERWFDEEIPVPIAWADGHALFVRLSAAYEDEFDRAAALGWPTVALDSTHLGIVTEPDAVANTIL